MATAVPVFTPDPDYIDRQLDAELNSAHGAGPARETTRTRLAREAIEEMAYIVRTALGCVTDALAGVDHITGPGAHDSALAGLGTMLEESAGNLRAAAELLTTTT